MKILYRLQKTFYFVGIFPPPYTLYKTNKGLKRVAVRSGKFQLIFDNLYIVEN